MIHKWESHVCNPDCGHMMSPDCWCEPARVYKVTGVNGLPVLVYEHNDETSQSHKTVLDARHRSGDWITSLLEGVGKGR